MERTAQDSRKENFFQVISRMFGPYGIQSIDDSAKEHIFHQVYQEISPAPQEVLSPLPTRHCYHIVPQTLNTILSAYGLDARVEEPFTHFFFGRQTTGAEGEYLEVAELDKGVRFFVKIVLWKFGSHLRALQALGSEEDIRGRLADCPLKELGHLDRQLSELRYRRVPQIEELSSEECHRLGYTISEGKASLAETSQAQTKGRANAEAYLYSDSIDIYLAGSMRGGNFSEFGVVSSRIQGHLRSQHRISPVIFDPAICWYESSFDKGLLEALMLKRSCMGVMIAGENDSFGKDSEVAHLLSQGKPVVVLVPHQDNQLRLRTFRDDHPLRIQVNPSTGVAHGLIAVDSIETCCLVVEDILLHKLETHVDYDYRTERDISTGVAEGTPKGSVTALLYYPKGSTQTEVTNGSGRGSVLRVVSQELPLTRVFWNRYFE